MGIGSLPYAASAQTAVDGAIGGNVKDASGAVISGATITIHNNGTSAEQAATTDSSGYFRVIHLLPGFYTVTIQAAGFRTYKSENVDVSVGLLTDVQPSLTLGASSETIEVSGDAPVINTTTNDFTTTIGIKELQDLPVNNYRWSAYALQSPGVVESGGFGLLSFRGQSTLLNNITIDGADDNQAFFLRNVEEPTSATQRPNPRSRSSRSTFRITPPSTAELPASSSMP